MEEKIQSVLVYKNNAWISRSFPNPFRKTTHDPVVVDRTLGTVCIIAHYVPDHDVLIVRLNADGSRFKDIGGAPQIFGLPTPTEYRDQKVLEMTAVRVPAPRKEALWPDSHPAAIEAAVAAWEAWLKEVDKTVDDHLNEMLVQGTMEA